jgi:hypothetical protein
MTPAKVLEDMYFTPEKQQEQQQYTPARFQPRAPPPAAPPPSPPVSTKKKKSSSNNMPSSYQKEQIPNYSRKGNRSEVPAVTNYSLTDGDEASNLLRPQQRSSRGDASLRPNTGFSNASEGEGEALLEVLWKMRILNIVGCIAALLLSLPDFFTHVFGLDPARVILGCYRSFFSIVLLCYESHTPYVRTMIIDQFGLIHHPVGRTFFLLLLSGLSIGQGPILDIFVGGLFILTAIMTFYAFIKYPEYRRIVDEQPNIVDIVKNRTSERFSWAETGASIVEKLSESEIDEGADILTQATERKSLLESFRR